MERKITVLPGDGIGPEVVASAVRVLQVIGKRFNHTFHLGYATIGGAAIDQHNNPLPDETIEMCENSDALSISLAQVVRDQLSWISQKTFLKCCLM